MNSDNWDPDILSQIQVQISALGVLQEVDPDVDEEMEGMEMLLLVLELRLQERELPRLPVFLACSDVVLASLVVPCCCWRLSQNRSARSRESPGDTEPNRCCASEDGGECGGVALPPPTASLPMAARAATSKAEMAVRRAALALVST